MPGKNLADICVDCKEKEAETLVRSRSLCQECFQKFLSYKFVRRLENFRERTSPDRQQKILLPLSFGASSTVLLYMWNSYLERKAARQPGRSGVKLHVLVIEPSTINSATPSCDERFASVQTSFPQHQFTKVSFHDIFEFDEKITDTIRAFAGTEFTDNESLSNRDRLETFRASISSATSRADIDTVLLTRLVVACAKKFDCHGVAWGDSDSRLAAKTLAGVAKGRGSSLTWQVCDGMTPWDLQFGFPLRDIYRPELELFASQIPSLSKIILPPEPPAENILNRNLSIDELMTQYVRNQGEKYRGVMANIVRTVDKLQPTPIGADTKYCTLCYGPIVGEDLTDTGHIGFCYGCARSAPVKPTRKEG